MNLVNLLIEGSIGMYKLFSLIVLVLLLLAGFVSSASAQYYDDGRAAAVSAAIRGDYYGGYYSSRGSYYRGYDPRMNDPRFYDKCHDSRDFYQGMRGNFHAVKGGVTHFRPCDPTNTRIGTVSGGALAGLGGAAIGGALGGRRGAAVGAVGGAVAGGIIASRRAHDNCLVVTQGQPREIEYLQESQQISMGKMPEGPISAGEGEGFTLTNATNVYVEAFDGSEYLGRMAPGGFLKVGPPKERYLGKAIVPQDDGTLTPVELFTRARSRGWMFSKHSSKEEE